MEETLKLKLFRQLLGKQGEEGFSLIELVVVVSVLAVLSAIAIPTFSCFQRKAQATAALAAIKQIHTECEINKSDTGNVGTFTSSNLNSYQIQSDGSNSCGGASGTGLISAIPTDTNILPTFILATNSSELTYSFKGQTGTDLSKGLGLVCNVANGYTGGSTFQANIEANSFVRKDTYIEKGCSAYVLVDGPNWTDANANAIALGGNLVSVTDLEENIWIGEEFSKAKYQYSDDNHSWAPNEWSINHFWTGAKRNPNGSWEWSNGDNFDNSFSNLVLNNNIEEGPDSNSDRLLAIFNNPNASNQNMYLDDMTNTPIEGSYQGLAELSICN
ncbi:prepilin-type N-terminal cleavage/methylation domain-containing protein [Prochlorococcus sp. MIT 0801]|uniref:prepilin-type N-terminal cleavage/methylation domain-containing protein n=1 Tax=Prochlorococcus sp. MIT 0801 TaxID=1501269 RepID=UPI0004F78989|nr:prepilin-type N-terminal cleavage/methylation domain-containing protein [Prochlorococcus sp. MIT 0801]AIQ97406.1 nuclease (SNase-like) protein [Prochlorococcus sp. MIT 0801]